MDRTAGPPPWPGKVCFTSAMLWLAIWLLASRGATAGVIDSPECRRDLAEPAVVGLFRSPEDQSSLKEGHFSPVV